MIDQVVANWKLFLRGEFPGGLDELLHDDVVFYSPVVFTPQRGKDITKLYLSAAGSTFDVSRQSECSEKPPTQAESGGFKYVKEIVSGNSAMFEFETTMGGKYVNGIDLITCDAYGKIVEFKVMIRPLQAVNAIHQAMGAMLEQLAGS